MTSILQIIAITIGVLALLFTGRQFYKDKITIIQTLFWSSIWISLILFVTFVSLLDPIAQFLGIGRPIDAVVYFSIIILFAGIYKINMKIELQNRQITELVRQQAIKNAKK